MNVDLKEQVAIVTGAGRGIGRAISLALAARGVRVILAARTRSQLEDVRRSVVDAGGEGQVVVADLSREEDVVRLFAEADRIYGSLDILINNAGIGRFGSVEETASTELDELLHVNLRGPFLCCREAMRIMRRQRRGTIINISSVVGFKGYPNQAAYTMTKHGIMGLTKSLAVEAQEHGIRVSVILPGGVDTDLVGDARPDLDRSDLLHGEDIAQATEYLLSLSDRAAIDQIYIRRRNSQPF